MTTLNGLSRIQQRLLELTEKKVSQPEMIERLAAEGIAASIATINRRLAELREKGLLPQVGTSKRTLRRRKHQPKKEVVNKYAHLPETGGVYMVRWSNELDWVKIGKGKDLRDRISSYGTYSPFALLATCLIEGDPDSLEQQLHEQFKDSRADGTEWFEMTPELEMFMEAVNEETGWKELMV